MDLRTGGMLKTPVVFFTSLSLLLSLSCAGDVISRSCSDVRQAFTTKGFSLHSVPHQEIPGENEVPTSCHITNSGDKRISPVRLGRRTARAHAEGLPSSPIYHQWA